MNIIGINKGHHASACFFEDEKLIYYNQEERLTRFKNDGGLPLFCLKNIKDICDDIDVVIITDYNYYKNYENLVCSFLRKLNFNIKKEIKIFSYFKSHHLSHASNAYCNSEFEDAIVFVSDGCGSSYSLNNGEQADESTTIFLKNQNQDFKMIYKRLYTSSLVDSNTNINWNIEACRCNTPLPIYYNKEAEIEIKNYFDIGFMYESVSRNLGFDDEGGKMMGMQSYGIDDDRCPPLLNGNNELDMEVIKLNKLSHLYFTLNNFQPNIAYAAQKAFEKIYINRIENYIKQTGVKNVVLTGGTALNVVANYRFKKYFGDDINLYVEPLCGDEGNCIGICQYFISTYTINKKLDTLYLCGSNPDYSCIPLKETEIITEVEYSDVVELLKQKNIVSIFQGKAEAGPRALGNRSILFDPRVINGKDIVNRIKGREFFRPFAATILHEHVNDWFDMAGIAESPYMMYAVEALEGVSKNIPSVVHVDNTCRIQTLKQNQNQHFYNLIKEFYNQTQVPILFNTSFNLAGDPIVETLDDALDTLRKSMIEYLYLPEIKKLIYIKNK